MIDYEAEIFNAVYPVVAPMCAKNRFLSTQALTLTAFPTVTLVEMDNITVRDRQSSKIGEEFARVTYQLDVYAQTKAECRTVYAAADEQMMHLGFNRFSGHFVMTPDNSKVFRYTARYQAEIDPDGMIYRRP